MQVKLEEVLLNKGELRRWIELENFRDHDELEERLFKPSPSHEINLEKDTEAQ